MVLEFLNENIGAFTIIFTAVVAIATVVYAILTWKLVSETSKLREIQSKPKISITLNPREEWINFIDLNIKNIGLGPAYNVSFKVDPPDYEHLKNWKLSDLGFVKYGLNYFAPNQVYNIFFANMIDKSKLKEKVKLTIAYESLSGKEYSDEFVLDLSQFESMSQLGEPPLYKIAKNFEIIQNDIHSLSTGFQRLKVIAFSKEDIDKEEQELMKRIKEDQSSNKSNPMHTTNTK